MNEQVREALKQGGIIDITTTGRKSGQPRRIEIAIHHVDGRFYISGMPRPQKRDWLANMEVHPDFTVHLKQDVKADLPAIAKPITDEAERRSLVQYMATVWKRDDVDEMARNSPLVEVTFK